jgi:YegS/Rv2252/BmrU family lipid kinase
MNQTDNKRKILFIINPISGGKDKDGIPTQIKKYFKTRPDYSISIQYTEYKGHAKQIVIQNKNNFQIIVAVGGDGTINEIGTSLINTGLILGIIPSGSGNGLAYGLGYKKHKNIKPYLDIITQATIKTIDTAYFNHIPFLNIAGFGFDGHIAYLFQNQTGRGLIGYARLILNSYFDYKAFSVQYQNKGKKYSLNNILFVNIANGTQLGNHFSISPASQFTDGSLEIIFLRSIPFYAIPNIIYKIRFGNILKSNYVQMIKAEELTFLPSTNEHFNIDGEYAGMGKEIHIQINKESLRIIVPSSQKKDV